MKILQTPPRYAPYIGGVERVAEELADHLLALGHDVQVVCADVPPGGPDLVKGVPVTRLKAVGALANTPITPALPLRLWRSEYDVIHSHLPTPWSADWSVLIARLRRKRAVLTFYNEIPGTGVEGVVAALYRATAQRVTFACAHVILVQSEAWRSTLADLYPRLTTKLTVIPNGVDTTRYRPPAGSAGRTRDLLFVSRLDRFHEYKGLDVLLRAVACCPEATLKVVGEGELRPRYEAQARDEGIAERVEFCGAVEHDELIGLYQRAGVFVLSSNGSNQEGGSSLVVLEAMSCGLPVIVATGAGDISAEAEAAGAGVSVDADDVRGLAAAITAMISNDEFRSTCGAAARRHIVANHDWREITQRVVRAYLPG